jgi:hypothetical protein
MKGNFRRFVLPFLILLFVPLAQLQAAEELTLLDFTHKAQLLQLFRSTRQWNVVPDRSFQIRLPTSEYTWVLTEKSELQGMPAKLAAIDDERSDECELVLQDVDEKLRTKIKVAMSTWWKSEMAKPIFLIVNSRFDGNKTTTRSLHGEKDLVAFEQLLELADCEKRFACFSSTAILAISPRNPREKRGKLLASYIETTGPTVQTWKHHPRMTREGEFALFKNATDRLFEELNADNLANDAVKNLEYGWRHYKSDHPDARPQNGERLLKLQIALAAADSNTDCSVTVITTRGANAGISCSKRAAPKEDLGLSVVQCSLERARYQFESKRKSKTTGTTGFIDCTGPSRIITIQER